ncbi:MAG: NHLP leader peptide family RiPP precursor [Microbacteriaceae bacterium]
MSDQDTNNKAFAQLVAHSWEDPDFRAKLLADPAGVLESETGFRAPDGKRVEIVEDTDEVIYVALLARPAELSDEALDEVAGGAACSTGMCCGTKEGGFSY